MVTLTLEENKKINDSKVFKRTFVLWCVAGGGVDRWLTVSDDTIDAPSPIETSIYVIVNQENSFILTMTDINSINLKLLLICEKTMKRVQCYTF